MKFIKSTEINGENMILPHFYLSGMFRMFYKLIILGPHPLLVFYEQLQNMHQISRIIEKLHF